MQGVVSPGRGSLPSYGGPLAMTPETASWLGAFFDAIGSPDIAEALKGAALDERLGDWTRLLTTAVVGTCTKIGWAAAAKGHPLNLLPKVGQEYLGLDVMAFGPAQVGSAVPHDRDDPAPPARWPMPVGVFELENSRDDDRVAYSLWKVLVARAPLRVVFAYRADWDSGRSLVHGLAKAVIEPLPIPGREALDGDTLVLLGSRGEGSTFPHGFFKIWRLDSGVGAFRKVV